MNQKQIGIVISYLNLAMGMVVNIFLTPLMISSLGDINYSLYKVMQSFAGPLSIFHLGISTVVTRCIVKYNSQDALAKQQKQNTFALAIISSVFMAILVSLIGVLLCLSIPNVYGDSYSNDNIIIGQRIFIIFMLSTVFHMLTDAFGGCLIGHERYAVSSLIQLSKTVLKAVCWIVLLELNIGVFGIVCVDLIVSVSVFVFSVVYSVGILHEIPKLYFWDIKQLYDIITFGAAIFLQAIVNQVNNNVDTMLLGVFATDKSVITMYSSALTIYMIYNSLISLISNFFLPKATRLINQKASGAEITDFVIGPGRFQACIAIACIFGFLLFGRNFIAVWIGTKYMEAYWIILMLMIPVTVPLVQNAMIAVLDASMKRIYRSIVLVCMAVFNVVISICLISVLDFWGAAIGTVISLVIGHIICMNIYYRKVFKLEIGRLFRSVFKGVFSAGLAAAICCLPMALFSPNTIIWFLIKCAIFILLYCMFLLKWGLDPSEKKIVKNMFKNKNYT